MFSLLFYLAVGFQFDFYSGCHWTNIVVKNGTWCCGGGGGMADVPENATLPVILETTPQIVTDVTTPLTTTTHPKPPVGDCPCGNHMVGMENAEKLPEKLQRILSQDPYGTSKLNRPWLVQIVLTKDSKKTIECTGSLLNKHWIISAAHCFCGTVVKCNSDRLSFKKIFESDKEPRLNSISLTIGTAKDNQQYFKGVEKLVIHPDYYQFTGDTVVGHTDVALLRLSEEIFSVNTYGNQTSTYPYVVPICLPPKLKYKMGEDQTEEGIHEPFEDLDCLLIPENKKNVPYPYTGVDINKGWLACHPGEFSHASEINIQGRNTFITAFGSTARQDVHEQVRYQCSTNSYGPTDSIFEYCHTKCHKDVKEPVEILTNYTGKSLVKSQIYANPSLADPVCEMFKKEKLEEALKIHDKEMGGPDLTEQGYMLNKKYNFLGWIKIRKRSTGEEVMCYPHKYSEGLRDARSMWDFPYRHGWCEVCKKGNTHDCMPSPDKNWGWCQPACDEPFLQPDIHDEAHEAVVDSFVYENCSKSINTWTEFCTGAPILSGYGQVWEYDDTFMDVWDKNITGGAFIKIKNELRKYHEETGWNGNNTILRPGSRYQAVQHSQATGDACYGDAGGSVWKYWMFRDQSNITDRRIHKLAVLTGVVSRFEEYCGVFRPDITRHYNKPVQHTIHTRITSIMDWINSWIFDGSCGLENLYTDLPTSTMESTEETATATEGGETSTEPG